MSLLPAEQTKSGGDAAGGDRLFTRRVHDLDWANLKADKPQPLPDLKICRGHVPCNMRILSIGSGTCQDVAYLAGNNEVCALDISPEAQRIAGGLGIKARLWDVSEGIPFPDGHFDVVVCKDVLEHVLDPEFVLKEIRRTLKNDGYAVVNVPNHFYFTLRWRLLLGKGLRWKTFHHDHTRHFEDWNYMHIRFFTYKSFRRLLSRCGFTDVRFFWDLGPLLHYSNPDVIIPNAERKLREGRVTPAGRRVVVRIILPFLKLFTIVFPRPVRSWITRLCPGLLSACFYVHCRKG